MQSSRGLGVNWWGLSLLVWYTPRHASPVFASCYGGIHTIAAAASVDFEKEIARYAFGLHFAHGVFEGDLFVFVSGNVLEDLREFLF